MAQIEVSQDRCDYCQTLSAPRPTGSGITEGWVRLHPNWRLSGMEIKFEYSHEFCSAKHRSEWLVKELDKWIDVCATHK